MSAKHVDSRNFQQEVLQSDVPVLIDFWAPWCGPCRAMGPVVDEVASEVAGRARVVKINVDEANDVASQFGVHSIPTFALVDKGEVRAAFSGVVPKSRLLEMLKPAHN